MGQVRKYFVLWRCKRKGGEHYSEQYLTLEGKITENVVNAGLFDSRESTKNWEETKSTLPFGFIAVEIGTELGRRIEKHSLKRRARELFGLPAKIPAKIMADRYEDAGMLEEAAVLRS